MEKHNEQREAPVEHHPLQPFLPPNARLLMLGSFPPPKNRWCMDFFYPNRTNMMWEIFGEVFFGDTQLLVDVENKCFRKAEIEQLLQDKGIAIYDTAQSVRRLAGNASDKYLEIVRKTDIPSLLQQIPLCHDIVCTGQKSTETICEDYGVALPMIGQHSCFRMAEREMRLWRMPSSSRAYPLPLTKKAAYYRNMMQIVLGD